LFVELNVLQTYSLIVAFSSHLRHSPTGFFFFGITPIDRKFIIKVQTQASPSNIPNFSFSSVFSSCLL
jgi:hypothetical protein